MKQKLEEMFLIHEGKKLRYGFTTGSAAAAAAKAAFLLLMEPKQKRDRVTIDTPKGIILEVDVQYLSVKTKEVTCGVIKDGGDDPDVTSGLMICARVSKTQKKIQEKKASQPFLIDIKGGKGVGRVTKLGLDQPIGEAAINRVPRKMIEKEIRESALEYHMDTDIEVEIFIPRGEEVAVKTFNPRLGIVGGLSVLGTSGIVVPMSEEALVKSIEVEISMHIAQGETQLLIAPGNYGENYIKKETGYDSSRLILCSNFVGKTMDLAVKYGAKKVVFVSHIGKAIKLSGGIMDTHSKSADSRAELMCAAAIRAGANIETSRKILETLSTEEAIALLKEEQLLKQCIEQVLEKILFYLKQRTGLQLEFEIIVYSQKDQTLGRIRG